MKMGKLASYFMPKLVLSLIVTASIIIKDREYGSLIGFSTDRTDRLGNSQRSGTLI
ncbi:hypothetical protein BDV30DRAFT_211162, partial [Aspergillus minisclerotigenes]